MPNYLSSISSTSWGDRSNCIGHRSGIDCPILWESLLSPVGLRGKRGDNQMDNYCKGIGLAIGHPCCIRQQREENNELVVCPIVYHTLSTIQQPYMCQSTQPFSNSHSRSSCTLECFIPPSGYKRDQSPLVIGYLYWRQNGHGPNTNV